MRRVPGPLVRVCVTGPESTGKTTLARQLAESCGGELVFEASRLYAEHRGAELLASDVDPIARAHLALADAAAERARTRGARLLVLDTDLVSTLVYARHYYDTAPRWIERAERDRRADLYLLCDVDVPWVADGVRDRPANREQMYDLFRRALERRHATVVRVHGSWTDRWMLARETVRALQRQPPRLARRVRQ